MRHNSSIVPPGQRTGRLRAVLEGGKVNAYRITAAGILVMASTGFLPLSCRVRAFSATSCPNPSRSVIFSTHSRQSKRAL
ncbi:hypothetical protein V6L77_18725 [Pannonibacter sp. Pt2-lr]